MFVWLGFLIHPFPPYWLYQDAPITLSLKGVFQYSLLLLLWNVSLISKEIESKAQLRFDQGLSPRPPSPKVSTQAQSHQGWCGYLYDITNITHIQVSCNFVILFIHIDIPNFQKRKLSNTNLLLFTEHSSQRTYEIFWFLILELNQNLSVIMQ